MKINYKKHIIVLVIANLLVIAMLFRGKNTPINYFKYKRIYNQKYSELMKIKKERDQIEQAIKLLSAQKVDTDLLEELLRQSLQYSRPNEKMIMIGDE